MNNFQAEDHLNNKMPKSVVEKAVQGGGMGWRNVGGRLCPRIYPLLGLNIGKSVGNCDLKTHAPSRSRPFFTTLLKVRNGLWPPKRKRSIENNLKSNTGNDRHG